MSNSSYILYYRGHKYERSKVNYDIGISLHKMQQFRSVNGNSSSSNSNVIDNSVGIKSIKPQVIAAALSEELEDNAIISVDSGTSTFWAARHISVRKGMKFSLSGTLASMA